MRSRACVLAVVLSGCVGAGSLEGSRVALQDEELVTAGLEVELGGSPRHTYEVERDGAPSAREWPDRGVRPTIFGRYRRGLGSRTEGRLALRSPALGSGVAGLGVELGFKVGVLDLDAHGLGVSLGVDAGASAAQLFGDERIQTYVLAHAHARAWIGVPVTSTLELYAVPTIRAERFFDRFDVGGEVALAESDAWGVGGGVGASLEARSERWTLELGGLMGSAPSLYVGIGVTR